MKEFKKGIQTLIYIGILVILLVIINNKLNIHTLLLNPSGKQVDSSVVMKKEIEPKLMIVKNTFTLKENSSLFIAKAQAADEMSGASALLALDLDTGEVLYSKNLKKRLPIASLTKIMTAVVVLDLVKPDSLIKITNYSSHVIPTRIGVVPDEKMSVRELIEAMLLTSANDAASVIQTGVDSEYGNQVFVRAMNAKAKFLGLSNSSYANPQGFDDPSNYSTVEDLAILTHYALQNYPLISETVKKDYDFLPQDQNHKQFDLNNWNGLLDVYPDTIGMKIGNTGDAGMTTVVVSNRGGKRILSVVLGAPDIYSRDLWAANLLNIGYEKTLNLPAITVTKRQLQDKYNSWYK